MPHDLRDSSSIVTFTKWMEIQVLLVRSAHSLILNYRSIFGNFDIAGNFRADVLPVK